MPSIAPPPSAAKRNGIEAYFTTKIEAAELLINSKTQNLRRLEAQRNALNARGQSASPLGELIGVLS